MSPHKVPADLLTRHMPVSNKNFLLTGGVGVLILAQFGITCGKFLNSRITPS